MPLDHDKIRDELIIEEGYKRLPYPDTKGKLTIGIGRNLTDNGLTDDEIEYLYENDVMRAGRMIQDRLPWVLDLDEVRMRVFYILVFNMGMGKLLTFIKMLLAAEKGDWTTAASELQNSEWFTEVGLRGPKLVYMLKTGEDLQVLQA